MKVLRKIKDLNTFSVLLLILIALSFSGCSNDDEVENDDNDLEEVVETVEPETEQPEDEVELLYEIFKETQTVYFEDNRGLTTIGYYEENKRVLDSVFDENLDFLWKIDRYYNNEGLIDQIVQYTGITDTIANRQIDYENGKIIAISRYRKLSETNMQFANVTVSYSANTILMVIEENSSPENREVTYSLDDTGRIYQEVDGPKFVEITYDGGLPLTKSYSNDTYSEQANFQYLSEPIPAEVWRTKWKNQVGSFNNQIISGFIGGLYQIELHVDLEKYLKSYADFNFEYDFNDAGLPVRIEKVNDEFKFIDTIEYKMK